MASAKFEREVVVKSTEKWETSIKTLSEEFTKEWKDVYEKLVGFLNMWETS